jgi:hypothetical protein
VIFFLFLVFPLVGCAIGASNDKGRGADGFILGFLLGPLGWLIVAALGASKKVRAQQAAKATAELVATVAAATVAATQATPPVVAQGRVVVPAGDGTIVERFAAQYQQPPAS